MKPSPTENIKKLIFIIAITLIVIVGVSLRLLIFDYQGGDHLTYKEAVADFMMGINPYKHTVESFQIDTPGNEHGYAYLPTLLYIQTFLVMLGSQFDTVIPATISFKIPVLLCDLGILYLIIKNLYKNSKGEINYIIIIAAAFFWFINPHFIARYEYTLYDPLFLFFLLVSFEYLGKKDFIAGILLAIAISLKTIPIIFIPIMLYKSVTKKMFILGMILWMVLISVPFLRSVEDFSYFIKGSLLVHGTRGVQGRPFVTLISINLYDYGINLYQHEFSKLYAALALMTGPIISAYLVYKKRIHTMYEIGLIIFLCYLLFTPVLSRTHIVWLIPFICVGLYNFIYKEETPKNTTIKYLSAQIFVYTCFFLYLLTWHTGFIAPAEFGGKPKIPQNTARVWEFKRIFTQEYYELRGKLKKPN